MTELAASSLSVWSDRPPRGRALATGTSLSLRPGEFVALLGPNGAGKTSLVRGLLGLAAYTDGRALLDGRAVRDYSPMERARRVAYLPQTRAIAWPAPVRDVVSLGRYAWGGAVGGLKGSDAKAVERALAACDLTHLAARSCVSLSGGELARVHLARAFAAEAPLLVADEPTAALDPRRGFEAMDLLRRFVDRGGGALVVLHDVALVARYASRLVWMTDGRIVADGSPEATLSSERLAEVYGVDASVEGGRVDLRAALP